MHGVCLLASVDLNLQSVVLSIYHVRFFECLTIFMLNQSIKSFAQTSIESIIDGQYDLIIEFVDPYIKNKSINIINGS